MSAPAAAPSIRRAAVWSAGAQYLTFAVQFVTSVVISRFFLDPAAVGLFSIALAAAMILAVLQDLGITRFISGQPDMRPALIRDYTAIAVGLGWLVAAIVILAAPQIERFYAVEGLAALLRIIGASYLVTPFALVSCALLIRDLDFRRLFWVNAAGALIGNGLAIALAARGWGAASLAWGLLATALVRAVVAQVCKPAWPRWPKSAAALAPLLRFGGSSAAISVSGAVGQRSQDLIVGGFLGLYATGLFTRAGGLAAQLTTLVNGAVNSVFYPAFAGKRDRGEPLAAPYLHLVACNTAVNWAAMVGLAVVAYPLVLFLYGDDWIGVAPLLAWTAIGEMFFIAIPLQMDVPILLGRIRTLVWLNIADTAATVLVLALACMVSLEAAAISRVVHAVIWWAIYAPFQRRLLGFAWTPLLATYAKSAFCALVGALPAAAFIVYMGPLQASMLGTALAAAAGGCCWVLALAVTRHPAWSEIRTFLVLVGSQLGRYRRSDWRAL